MDMSAVKGLIADFGRDDDGSQIVEYGLVIALISIAVAGLLGAAFSSTNPFATLVIRIKDCMTAGGTCS